MKPRLLTVLKDHTLSFNARRGTRPDVNNHWHYHNELELVYFKNGSGTQFIGDNIASFVLGDVVLVGSNLPHYWQFDPNYFNDEHQPGVDVSVVHFNPDFWGAPFLGLPENKEIRTLFEKARRGIQLREPGNLTGSKIENIVNESGTRRIILLLEVLLDLSCSSDTKQLASAGFKHNFNENEKDRINAIYNYSISNFRKKITLEEIAAVASMSPNSFCKYFKSKSKKTFSEFVAEIRIGQACKLLMDGNLNIKEVCYESGFNNFTSFHKVFKAIKGKSPLAYQKSLGKG